MPLDELQKVPLVGGCLTRIAAFAFGGPFVWLGVHLWVAGAGDHPLVEAGLGLLLVLTGAMVLVPWGLGYRKAQRPLMLLWVGTLALFLLSALVAKLLGLV